MLPFFASELDTAPGSKPLSARRGWWINWLVIGCGAIYAGIDAAVWLLGDRNWFGTLLVFAPRHLLCWPLLGLLITLPWASWKQRLALGVLCIYGLLSVCNYCLPVYPVGSPGGQALRVLTLNTGQFPAGPAQFLKLLKDIEPDLVTLQWDGPRQHVEWPRGWTSHHAGKLEMASRYPLSPLPSVMRDPPDQWPHVVAIFGLLQTPRGEFHVGTTHLISPRPGLSQLVSSRTVLNLARRDVVDREVVRRARESRQAAEAATLQGPDVIVTGDFNMPVDSGIFRDDWGHLANAYSRKGWGFGNTAFASFPGFTLAGRIDHVLFGTSWTCHRCWIGPDVGSDHRPVIADLQCIRAAPIPIP